MCSLIKGKVLLLFTCYAGVVTRETKGTFVWSMALIKNTVMKQINQDSFVWKKWWAQGTHATEVELTQSPQPGYSHTLFSESLGSINYFCIDNTWDHALGRETMQPNVLLWFTMLFISLYLAVCYPSTNSKWGLKVSKYQLSNQKKNWICFHFFNFAYLKHITISLPQFISIEFVKRA